MKLTSPVFDNNGQIPPIYSCDGDNISPPFEISDIPASAKSLALIVYDPDAPNGHFLHWMMWDINPSVDNIEQNGVPEDAIQGINSAGNIGYNGPCPPSGSHRYVFTLYALDRELNLSYDTSESDLLRAMESHILTTAELIGLYTRQPI